MLTDKQRQVGELVIEASGLGSIPELEQSAAKAKAAGVELEINPFQGFNQAKADGHTYILFDLRGVKGLLSKRPFAVATIPTGWDFKRFVVGYHKTEAKAAAWIKAKGQADYHAFRMI
jgi:hypothetical protein